MHCRYFLTFHRLSGAESPILPFLAPSILARCSAIPTSARPLSTTKKRNNSPGSRNERLASRGDDLFDQPQKILILREPVRDIYVYRNARRYHPSVLEDDSERSVRAFKPHSRNWITSFGLLNAKYHTKYHTRIEKSTVETKLRLHHRTATWVRILLSNGSDVEAISKTWFQNTEEKSLTIWISVMLWALQSSPPLALNILEATHTDTYLRDYIVADSLEYISNYLLQESEGKDSEAVDNLHRVLRLVVHRRSGLAICITQKTFFLLLKYSTKEQALALFNEFAPRGVLHHYTSFRLASTLATTGEHNLAFRIIQTLFSSGFSLSDSSIRSVCLQILHSSAANGRGYAQSSDLLFQMLQMGLRPNLELYNVILLNAFEGGDHETAFNIYSTMKANGLGPDDCTYSILLKGAELTGDRDTFRKIIQEAEASGSIMGNPYILTQMLLHIRRTHSYESRFSEMLSLYKKHFETQPLLDLDLKFAQMHESVGLLERINPPPVTLGVMLVSFLERCNDLNIAWALYKQFRRQAEAGHPIISPLIESQDTCNAFILTFGRTQTTLHLCTTVIGDMLKPLAGNVINTGTGKPTQQAQPNVQTWSLLVKAFLRHGQSTAAEKIMNMMKKCGAEPNQVTWNTLVSGYSRMQNIDAAARTMKRMEMEGWGVDDYTLKGLGNVHDRQKLTAAFERLEGEQQEGMLPKDTDMMDITFHKNSSQTKTADNTYDSTYDDPPMQKAHFG